MNLVNGNLKFLNSGKANSPPVKQVDTGKASYVDELTAQFQSQAINHQLIINFFAVSSPITTSPLLPSIPAATL